MPNVTKLQRINHCDQCLTHYEHHPLAPGNVKILNWWTYNTRCWEKIAKLYIPSYDSSLIYLQQKFTNFALFERQYERQSSAVQNAINVPCLWNKLLQIKCFLRLLYPVGDKSCKRFILFRRNHINRWRKCHEQRKRTGHNWTEQMNALGLFWWKIGIYSVP